MSEKKPSLKVKIGKIKLTQREKEVIAVALDSEVFRIIRKKILPQRTIQLSMTSIGTAQTFDEVQLFRGRYMEVTWLLDFLEKESAKIDVDDGDPDDDGLKSKATTSSRQT